MFGNGGLVGTHFRCQVADTHLLLLEQVQHQQTTGVRHRFCDLRPCFISFAGYFIHGDIAMIARRAEFVNPQSTDSGTTTFEDCRVKLEFSVGH